MSDDAYEIAAKIVSMPQPKTARYNTVYRLVNLTSDDPFEKVLATSDRRFCAWIMPHDDDIFICDNLSDAKAGTGALIPKRITAPWPIYDTGDVHIAASGIMAGAVSRVTIISTYITYEG